MVLGGEYHPEGQDDAHHLGPASSTPHSPPPSPPPVPQSRPTEPQPHPSTSDVPRIYPQVQPPLNVEVPPRPLHPEVAVIPSEPAAPQGESTASEEGEDESFMLLEARHSIRDASYLFEEEYVKHYNPKLLMTVGVICAVVAVLSVWSWMTFTPHDWPWFIYPVAIALTVFLLFAITGSGKVQNKLWAGHLAVYGIWNFVLIISNMQARGFAWSVVTLVLSSIFLSAHAIRVYYPRFFNFFNIHFIVFCGLNFLLYFAWCFSHTKVPWFLFVAIPWAGLLFLHAALFLRKRKTRRPPAPVGSHSQEVQDSVSAANSVSNPPVAVAGPPPSRDIQV